MVTRVCGSRRERCMAGVPRPNRVAKGRRHRHGSQRHFWVAPSNGFCFEMFVENHGDLNWIDFQVFVDVLSMSFFGPKEREAWAALGWWVIIDDSIHDSRSKDTWNIRPLVGGPAPQLFWYTSRFRFLMGVSMNCSSFTTFSHIARGIKKLFEYIWVML